MTIPDFHLNPQVAKYGRGHFVDKVMGKMGVFWGQFCWQLVVINLYAHI